MAYVEPFLAIDDLHRSFYISTQSTFHGTTFFFRDNQYIPPSTKLVTVTSLRLKACNSKNQ